MAPAPGGPMRTTKKRPLILCLASAAAGFALPGCGDSSEANTTPAADAAHDAPRTLGSVVMPPGSVITPYDASDDSTPVITGSFVAPPDASDAGDGPHLIGSVVQSPDA